MISLASSETSLIMKKSHKIQRFSTACLKILLYSPDFIFSKIKSIQFWKSCTHNDVYLKTPNLLSVSLNSKTIILNKCYFTGIRML